MGSPVTIYDPTITVLPKLHSNISHMPLALESKNSSHFKETCSLKDLNLRKHDEGLYLKLDIEGSEWELLLELGEGILAFDQMFIEFYDLFKLSDPNFRSTAIKVIDLLVLNFKVLNFHSNNWRTFVQFGDAFIPEVFKVTFVRNDICENLPKQSLTDTIGNLNFPNNPNRLEIPSGMYTSSGKFIA